MANSIRTPRQGVTETSRRIARAVDDEDWQKVRVGMKGTSTEDKLSTLRSYWHGNIHEHVIKRDDVRDVYQYDCDICIRIDNYIKALCRGGQLEAGEDIYTALFSNWKLNIRK